VVELFVSVHQCWSARHNLAAKKCNFFISVHVFYMNYISLLSNHNDTKSPACVGTTLSDGYIYDDPGTRGDTRDDIVFLCVS